MELRKDAKYAMVVPTSMGIRITPENGQPVHVSDRYFMQATSAETNVASVPAALGLPTKVLTAFVEGSPISSFIKRDLRARCMDFEGPEVPQGDAWGYRHQFNIADSGYGTRGARVWNDRAGEVGRELDVKDFDLEQLFERDGVQVLHLSGLVAAISPKTSAFCVELAKVAKRNGTLVSMDMNYRASFWKGREAELRAAFQEICHLCDILIGNEEDFQLALGIEGPEAGGDAISDKIDGFKEMMGRVQAEYPNASLYATTLREVVSVNTHKWGMIVYGDGGWHVAESREIGVLDRVGGGDGSVGGLLYGVLKGWDAEKCMQFGWATGALAATMMTDYGSPADEEQVWSIWEGNARIKR